LTSIVWTKKYNGSQWELKLFGYQHSLKYLLLCSADERNAMQRMTEFSFLSFFL